MTMRAPPATWRAHLPKVGQLEKACEVGRVRRLLRHARARALLRQEEGWEGAVAVRRAPLHGRGPDVVAAAAAVGPTAVAAVPAIPRVTVLLRLLSRRTGGAVARGERRPDGGHVLQAAAAAAAAAVLSDG